MAAPIVNSSSIPLTGTAVVTQGCEPGLVESTAGVSGASPPTAADFINPYSRPGFFLLDLRSQGPPSAGPPPTKTDDAGGTALPAGGNFLPLFLFQALRQQPDPTVPPPGAGTGSPPSSEPTPTATTPTTTGDPPVTRRPGVFEPLLQTAHRVMELFQPTDVDRRDPICAAPAPTPAVAIDATKSELPPAIAATVAIAKAAPDMLAALMKRITQNAGPRESPKPSSDAATFTPVIERTGDTSGTAPSTPPAIKALIDALPKPGTLDQLTDAVKDVGGARPADAPPTAFFIDGHTFRAHSAPADPAAQTLKLDVPMRSPEWAHALGEKITWLVDQNLSTAQIKLNPPQLGPIEVRIAISGDSAQVSVSAHNGITRDALEAAAPRLREALTSHGFGGVSVDISQHSFNERPMPQSQPDRWEPWQAITAGNDSVSTARPQRWQPAGRLDAYA